MRLSNTKWLWLSLAGLLILAASFLFDNKGQMHPIWSYPYFSGAANYSSPEGWSYSNDKYSEIQEILKEEDFESILQSRRFAESYDRRKFHLNDKGYVHLIVAAKTLFPFLSDMDAIEFLQILVHLFGCLFLLLQFKTRNQQLAFFILYAVNPLVISYVTYPFYYFWQALPAMVILPYLLSKEYRYNWLLVLVAFLAGLSFATRPSTVFLLAFLLFLAFRREKKYLFALALVVFLVSGFGLRGSEILKSPWHTAYISIGAYPNPDDLTFIDKTAEDYFFKETGERVNPDLPNGALLNPEKYEQYAAKVKEGYLNFASSNPFVLIRNAGLNVLQSFGLGYFEFKARPLSYLSAFLGFLFLSFLFWRKSWLFILAIFFAALGYAPYTPPVTRYLFGSIVLILAALIVEMSRARSSLKKSESSLN